MSLAVSIRDLKVHTNNSRLLLDVPELHIEPGQTLGISGPSGAGKSTLLMALSGILDNAQGQVSWGDSDLLSLSAEKRGLFRSLNMGLIFQDFLLFEELSALENAVISHLYLPKATSEEIREKAEFHLRRLGINYLQQSVASFSGGERQRVAVARALANDPPVILADEPTASLNREAADRLSDDLVEICKAGDKTLIVVTHDPFLLAKMDRVLTLTDGKVSADTGAQS
jgi:ABC-type lipoprotein export system ATPase subunit